MAFTQGLLIIKAFRQGTGTTDKRVLCQGGIVSTEVEAVAVSSVDWTATGVSVHRNNGSGYDPVTIDVPGSSANMFENITYPDGSSGPILSLVPSTSSLTRLLRINLDNVLKLSQVTIGPAAERQAFNRLIDTFVVGGYMDISLNASSETLRIQLRSLKTGDYLLQDNVLHPAHHPAAIETAANLLTTDVDTTFTVALSGYGLPSGVSLSSVEGLQDKITLAATSCAPTGSATSDVELQVQGSYEGIAAAGIASSTPNCTVPIDIHVPTDIVVLLDRSGSMADPVHFDGGAPIKWEAARDLALLFGQLYGQLIPTKTATVAPMTPLSLADVHRISFGSFWSAGPFQENYEGFASPPSSMSPDSPFGGTPIGEALISAHGKLTTASSSKWTRRQVLLLTDGQSNTGTPAIEDVTAAAGSFVSLDSNESEGVILHGISFARATDTPKDIAPLASFCNGEYQSTATDDSSSLEALRGSFMSLLEKVTVSQYSSLGSSSDHVAEPGLERLVFVSTQKPSSGNLTVEKTEYDQNIPGLSTVDVVVAAAGTVGEYAWATVDDPVAGATYRLKNEPADASFYALYDLSVKSRFGVEPPAIDRDLDLWAELKYDGTAIEQADVRVAVDSPSGSLGEMLSAFAQSGGLVKAIQRGTLVSAEVSAALKAAGRSLAVPSVQIQRGSLASLSVLAAQQTTSDVTSVSSLLLDAWQAASNLEFQYDRRSITLRHVADGRYEARVPAELITAEGIYTMKFRVDGRAGTVPFSRDHRFSRILEQVPVPELSESFLVKLREGDSSTLWSATVVPKTKKGWRLGPGLDRNVAFAFADQKLRDNRDLRQLETVDNLDGSYTTFAEIPTSVLPPDQAPPIALYFGNPDRDAPSIIAKDQRVRRVRVTLDRLQVVDDHDPLCKGPGELVFSAVVAPNASPTRAVRTRFPEQGHLSISSGKTLDIGEDIYDGWLETGAELSVALSGEELDWPACFDKNDHLTRYLRRIPLNSGQYGPDDEANDPEDLRDWKVWYSVKVG